MRIVNLASGSKANSTFVSFENTKLLIDAGLSVRDLSARLTSIDEKIEEIDAILITHEHSDHIKGLATLVKRYGMDVYVHQKLADSGIFGGINFKQGELKTFNENLFSVKQIEVLPFKISHDAICPVGFVLNAVSSNSKVGFVTDTGMVTDAMLQALSGVKMAFIESNYDENMLLSGFYPAEVKKRILSNVGHLSNLQSVELAEKLYIAGAKCFILSHISENNNNRELAYKNYKSFFENQGLVLDKDVYIRLSFQDKCSNNFNLKED